MASKKGSRIKVGLKCSVCGKHNYTTEKNRNNSQDRLELSKHCPECNKHTKHTEMKKLH
ncbi:MAG: 50S ribosomal protein L33 [Patescibacteria group bacterium]|nr:MAG: 50S ribosomal protein L33 [Patescibacteria group bacterium]